ncbi:hypothetical protein [Paenibacillus sp. OV219]|uniref:hypothetical protein n=1 Tax=Paenibacillus sp. OV219 TaxID=1884377 RepID=UPI0008B38A01|nr:hypothetical protein [Paenibacillus sp. OV219]SEP00688.1 hypothetical protein SAMN05518847_11427 [Paenibacillus sp. OV219]
MNVSEDKDRLRSILERDEYTVYHHESNNNTLSEWLRGLLRKLMDLFPSVHMSRGQESITTYALAAIILALLIAALYWFAKQMVRQGQIRQRLQLSEDELTWSYRDYLQNAEQLKKEGALRESVRFIFLALLFYMQECRWVRIEKGKTNWEYAEELKLGNDGLLPLFKSGAILFDRVWYGKEAIQEASLNEFYEQVRSVIQATAPEGGARSEAR